MTGFSRDGGEALARATHLTKATRKAPLRVLLAHNRYQQAGGEDRVVTAEAEMLRRGGHQVELLAFDNEGIEGSRAAASAALSAFYSRSSATRIGATLQQFRPDILHVHNFLPTMSPAVFYEAEKAEVATVQTLHNYRFVCANGQLFRDGEVCERCLEKRSILPGIRYGCYRGSRMGSAVMGGTVALQTRLGTWQQRVARYIALSEFAAGKLGEFRLPTERIRVKPNFVVDRGTGTGSGGYALFVGRLSEEKGLSTLIAADRTGRLPLPVWLAGDGPLRTAVEAACARPGSRLVYLGPLDSAETQRRMREAAVLLVPSLWYEGFPMVMVEALSVGLPVIASRLGSMPEIVEDGVCGLLHTPADAEALLDAMRIFVDCNAAQPGAMRLAARERYLRLYGEDANRHLLLMIYGEALETVRPSRYGST